MFLYASISPGNATADRETESAPTNVYARRVVLFSGSPDIIIFGHEQHHLAQYRVAKHIAAAPAWHWHNTAIAKSLNNLLYIYYII